MKTRGKETTWKTSSRCDDYIKTDLEEVGIDVDRDMDR